MITIHHLGVSQSDRIVWLMEELGLPYGLKWHNREANGLAPDSFLALHPAATAPVIEDGDTVLTESAVIVEFICQRYAGGKLTVPPNAPNYFEYQFWMHFNNTALGLLFAKLALSGGVRDARGELVRTVTQRREQRYLDYMNTKLGTTDYLAGSEFTCADVMVMFPLTTIWTFGTDSGEDRPNIRSYVRRIAARPAYIKAMKIAGPQAVPL